MPLPSRGAAATGVYVPPGLEPGHAHRGPEKRKVGLTKKALAMNKSGQHRRAEMEHASPPPKHAALKRSFAFRESSFGGGVSKSFAYWIPFGFTRS